MFAIKRHGPTLIVAGWAILIPAFVLAQSGDFNADGVFDCFDLNLLHDGIRESSTDPRFDLDGSGGPVDLNDVHTWFAERAEVVGHRTMGDFNLDGQVDERDGNIMGINWQQHDRNYCQGDADSDGVVNAADKGVMDVNFLVGTIWPRPQSDATLSPISDSLSVWNSGEAAVIAQTDQFQLTARPVLSPDGLLITVIGLRTQDSSDRIVSITDMSFEGELHQAAYGLAPDFISRTITLNDFSPARDGVIARTDSFILLDSRTDVAMEIIAGVYGMAEENDASNPVALHADALGAEFAVFGIGSLQSLLDDYGGSVLAREKQSRFIELAQLTTPARMPGTDRAGRVSMSFGVLGADADDQPMDEWARFGTDVPIPVPFLFPPCDYDRDGFCTVEDINQLVDAAGTEDPHRNLVQPDIIDTRDIDAWLSWASDMSPDHTLRPGDVNLDGTVDARDLNVLGLHWQQQLDTAAWEKGDFNGDRIVNAQDLNALALSWAGTSEHAIENVPEPVMTPAMAMLVAICLCMSHRKRSAATQDGLPSSSFGRIGDGLGSPSYRLTASC